jgi:hypothetical protein
LIRNRRRAFPLKSWLKITFVRARTPFWARGKLSRNRFGATQNAIFSLVRDKFGWRSRLPETVDRRRHERAFVSQIATNGESRVREEPSRCGVSWRYKAKRHLTTRAVSGADAIGCAAIGLDAEAAQSGQSDDARAAAIRLARARAVSIFSL